MADVYGFDVSEWLDMMADTIYINSWLSNSVSGFPTYSGTQQSSLAYIEIKNHRIIDSMGREVMARGKVFMGSSLVVDVRDKLTLPSEYQPANPPILAVNIANDEKGNHHTVLEIG